MIYVFADCEVDAQRHEIRRGGQRRHVEPQVFDVLRHLLEHRDRLVPRDELLDSIWGHRFVAPTTLSSRIKAARQAIGDDGNTQRMIRTIHGRGFRFMAEVNVQGGAVPAGVALVSQAHTIESLAVVPFVNVSPDPDNEYFSDGVTEELLNVLTRLGRFRVPARTSSFAFKGKDLDVREIGRQLGVDALVMGSVRKSGDRVRIASQLVNVRDGFQLWSESYERTLDDIFALQDEIAVRVTEALDIHLTVHERANIRKAPTDNVRAYEYYLLGRHHFYNLNHESIEHARELYARAIELDPAYALAHAGTADACSFLHMYWDHTEANLAAALEASRRALEYDPALPEAHAARGLALSLEKNYEEARRELERAIELDPTLFAAYYYAGRAAWAAGDTAAAERYFRKANEVRPEDFQSLSLLSSLYSRLGRPDQQRDVARQGLAVIRRHLQLYPDDIRARYMGAGALVVTGELEEGRRWLEQLFPITDPAVFYNAACTYVLLGDTDAAIECLEGAVDVGFSHREWMANDPDLAPLASAPRFAALLARIGS